MRDQPAAFFAFESTVEGYKQAVYGANLIGYVIRRSHALLEEFLPAVEEMNSVLEVGGGGGGEHISYVKHGFREYFLTDGDQKMLRHAEATITDSRVKFLEAPAENLPFADNRFDRLLACNVLEHIHHPYEALREWSRVVRPGGIISLILPCDPGLVYRLSRMISSTRRLALRTGVPYDYLVAREHVNPIGNLVSIIRYHFENIRELWWPLRLPSTDINLFYEVHIIN
jgi:ubiquinone/menaquinone biosynthesis C-methylase UbiE